MKTNASGRKSNIPVGMAIEYYQTKRALGRALAIDPSVISKWGEFIPELYAYKLHVITGYDFPFALDGKGRHKPAPKKRAAA